MKNNEKIELIKTVGIFIVSIGVGAIISNAVGATSPKDMGKFKKVTIVVGSFVLGSMISDKCAEYAEEKIDNIINRVKKMVKDDDKEEIIEEKAVDDEAAKIIIELNSEKKEE